MSTAGNDRSHCASSPPTALLPLTPPLDNIPATPLMQRVTERHAEIHRLRKATWTISAIARQFGLDRKTVRRYLTTDLEVLIASARDRRPRQLDLYRPYLQQRFDDGCTNAAQLYREIHEHGYRGNHQAVRLYIRSMRVGTAAAEPPRLIPTPGRITSWIMRPRDGLSREEQDQLDEVRIACPDIATASNLAHVFAGLVRDRRGHLLAGWVREAETNGPGPVRGFAGFLRQDWDAVLADMTLDYSSGVVEGHVNRLRRSSGRCTDGDLSGSSAPASCCDRDHPEIPTRASLKEPYCCSAHALDRASLSRARDFSRLGLRRSTSPWRGCGCRAEPSLWGSRPPRSAACC
ncbi:hypothetical protein [Streptomyces sp. R35]|uniref:HTH IS21-type domain-containing protein n=1 Tax=Streptomyces sp. R35 TaxID=3238630 RepID=A0AB39RW74_9ACTN